MNNVEGSKSFIEAVARAGAKKAIGISTDKAANPSNVYGMTKYIMERMFMEANRDYDTLFTCTRFGNLVDSRRSLVAFWKEHPELYGSH